MGKKVTIAVNQIISDIMNFEKLKWTEITKNKSTALYENNGFEIEVEKVITSTEDAKRERYTYRGKIFFTYPPSGKKELSSLPISSRDSYKGLIRNNKGLIVARMKQHFSNYSNITLVDSLRVEI